MSTPPTPTLRDIRRGQDPNLLELIDERGYVVLLRAYGLNPEEQRRTRERALALLVPLVGLSK